MDALIRQLADLEPAQRWSLLCRLARMYPADVQHALTKIQRTSYQDVTVTRYELHGFEASDVERVA